MTNEVTVDEAALAAEADRAAAGAPADALPTEAQPEAGEGGAIDQANATAADYEPVAYMLFDQLAGFIVPAWEVTHEEKAQLAKATANALALWFPDQVIPPKYLALLGVAGAAYTIVAARRDPKTGSLKPRRLDAPKPAAAANAAAS